jgi:hypothetical protein
MTFVDRISWPIALALVGFLGLSPFVPEPHVWEKLKMLFDGTLTQPVDVFDLALHGTPWVLFALKLVRLPSTPRDPQ